MPLSDTETVVLEALCSVPGFELPDEPWSVTAKSGFLVLGLTSKVMPLLAQECGKMLGCTVSPMALLEYPTPLELAAHLAELPKSGGTTAASAEAKAAAAKRLATTASEGGAPTAKPLRVLALHGQYVNATIMQMATTPLVTAARKLGLKLEIVCPNGRLKHTVAELKGQIPDDPVWSRWGLRDVYRWSEHDDAGGVRSLPDADAAVAHLRRVLHEQGPFDGAIGFSNGAAVLQLAMRTFEGDTALDVPSTVDISEGGTTNTNTNTTGAAAPAPPLKFGVFIGPCVPGWPKQKPELYTSPSTTPSFVLSGRKDDYCGKASDPTGEKFGSLISEPFRVLRTHADGHQPFPESAAEAAALAAELAAFMKDPTGFVAEEPARVAAAQSKAKEAAAAEMAAADPALIALLEEGSLTHLTELLVGMRLDEYISMYQKEDRSGLISHLKGKGVDKLKERKAFASLVEEKAG